VDNADERLTPVGRRVGLVQDDRWALFEKKQAQKATLLNLIRSERKDQWLRRPENTIGGLFSWFLPKLGEPPVHGVLMTVETEVKYEGYLQQQERHILRLRNSEGRRIPPEIEYDNVAGLSREVKEKLNRVRPSTLGQAARIPGVTPAAIAILDVYMSLR
jgi:tRNA uridine 5-carboxymethylaminomethyl modification enzyme